MSFTGLWIGVSGLTAAQKALEVAGHNIANVNTEGYTRQRVELQSARPTPGTFGRRGDGMKGMGVTVADVVRLRATLADQAYRSETNNLAGWQAKSEVLSRAEQVLGPVGGGAPEALSAFYASWDQLSLYPQDLAARRGVLDAGANVARSLNSAASQLETVSLGTAAMVRESVDGVNQMAQQVAKLNAAIFDAVNGAQSPNDLMDQRDELIDKLASLVGATARASDGGLIDIVVGGHTLVAGESTSKIVADGSVPCAVTWQDGSGAVTMGGRLGGLHETATVTILSLRQTIDDIAVGLRDTVNLAHHAGFDQDGAAGVDFFTGAGAADFAVNPALTDRMVAASASGAAADGNNAIAVAKLRAEPGVNGATVQDSLHALAGRLGSLAAQAKSAASASEMTLTGIKQERAETNSVSTDEELADIVRFQHSYEAAARVITVVDQLLDRLINGTGMAGR